MPYLRIAAPTISQAKPPAKRLKQMIALKPRGMPDGPKRTPPTMGDSWQHQTSFEVEQVYIMYLYCFFVCW